MKKNILILLFLSACTNYEYEPAELEPELLTEPLQSGRFRVNNSRIEGVAGTPTYARTANAVTDIDFMRCLLQAFPSANWVCYPDYQHRCACETYGTCPKDSGQLLEPRVYEGVRGGTRLGNLAVPRATEHEYQSRASDPEQPLEPASAQLPRAVVGARDRVLAPAVEHVSG